MAESSRLKQIQDEVASSASDDLQVHGDPSKVPWHRSFIHFWTLVGTFFWRNRCQVRASALAYTTLLALIPLLAVSVSMLVVFKSSDAETRINVWIEELVQHVAPTLGLSDQGDGDSARKVVVNNIVSYVSNIRFGTIGITAMAGLVFAAISLMRTIEAAFNDIWGASRSRSWWNSILLYWGVLTLGPAVLVIVTTSTYVRAGIDHVSWIKEMPLIGVLNTALLPIGTLTIAFGLFYLLMPNTRVEARSAAIGALVAAGLWWANSQLGAFYNTRVVGYSKIYGSLGAVPLFLLGLYFSWLILLFGAQVAYVYQNRHAYLQEKQAEKIHQQGREFAALRIISEISRRFDRGEPQVGASALSNRLGIPPKLTQNLLRSMTDARLLTETVGLESSFVPARPIEQISVNSVLVALRTANGQDLVTAEDSLREVIRTELTAVRRAESDRADDLTLADLVRKA